LICEDGSGKEVKVTLNELGSLTVDEKAVFVDELDDPTIEISRNCTDINNLTLSRLLDWQAKIFLTRAMLPYVGKSPKTAEFRKAFNAVHAELSGYHRSMGIEVSSKTWSVWTIYHDMLRWRASRYELAALQVKGVEYRPWKKVHPLYKIAREIAEEIKLTQPTLSVATVHRQVMERLSKNLQHWKGENEERSN